MRTKESVKNIVAAMISYFVTLIVGFVARSYFVQLLGAEYLGINSLFCNIISVMSVVELGFGSAIIYNLYRPLSNNEIEQIKSLMKFYQKVYRVIAGVVFVLGMTIMPFIPVIVGETTINENLFILFFLFVVDATASYLLTYKRSIFYADQRNYIVNLIHAVLYLLINISQICILSIYKNYVIYLVIQIMLHVAENIIISLYANKTYSYLKENSEIQPLSEQTKNDIIRKVKGLFFHQIGSAIVMGTDNIIISMTKALGVVMVGKFSNYTMIVSNLNSLTSQIFTSVTASVGNLLVEKDREDSYIVYKRILFLNAALINFMCVSVCCIMEPFVSIWVGKDYILPFSVLIVVTINFYVQGMKRTCGIFKNAAGIFYEDRYVPLVESILNLFFSILFVKLFGLAGVCLGTVLSSCVHWFYDFPVFVYGYIFKKKVSDYFRDYLGYAIIFIVSLVFTYIIFKHVLPSGGVFERFIIAIICCVFIPNLIFIFIYRKSQEYIYWKNLLMQKLRRGSIE